MKRNFKVKAIVNSAIEIDDTAHCIFFFIIENQYGKFLLNWSKISHEELLNNKLPHLAQIKNMQLKCVEGEWLEKGSTVLIQEVVNGELGLIHEKIKQIAEGTTEGQRVLIALDSRELDSEFYRGLGVDINNIPNTTVSHGTLEENNLTIGAPFTSIDM